jgi:3-oxoacyl-[acyl-carrier protein] reductase
VGLNEKVAIVTGAARGIGREYACCLAAAGAAVAVADQRDCSETVSQIEAAGGKALGFKTDIADSQSTRALAGAAVEAFGRIDILVNNAALYGSLKSGRFEDIAEAEWDACMAVNVKGIWNCCKAVVPAMRKGNQGGSIINISSLGAVYGMPYSLHYVVFGAKSEKAKQVIASNQALQKNLETGDLAGTLLYLASDASRFVTGQTIMVDGGSVFL